MNKAIIIGSLNMDIVAYVQQQPKVGETVFGRSVNYFAGGKGSNQAIACQKLGCETMMVGQIGDDAFGAQLLSHQASTGIDVRHICKHNAMATGTAFITVNENGDNAIVVIPGANAIWDDNFIDAVEIEQNDIVVSPFEIPDKVITSAFAKAKANGALTILNPAPVRPISDEIQALTDFLVVNEHELAAISGLKVSPSNEDEIADAINKLEKLGNYAVIVTLGDQGVRLMEAGDYIRIHAKDVNAIDTTGAGDTFIGGFTAGLLAGLSLSQAANLGNNAASISVTREGATTSIPTLAEVNALQSSGG